MKCKVCVSYKLKDMRFVAKKLPKNIANMQKYYNQMHDLGEQRCSHETNLTIMDSWINLPPMVPNQSIVPCFGIIKDNNNDNYALSELILDYTMISS